MKERKNKFIKEKHVAYKRIVEDSRVAVLCIHGFMGSPNQYRDIVPQIPQDISVYNIILDGHGGKTLDFGRTSMEKWEQNVEDAITELLETHEEIYILSHSMGAFFAIEQAIKRPEIKKLFCIGLPVRIKMKPIMLKTIYKLYFGNITPKDTVALGAMESHGVAISKNLLKYVTWIPRIREFYKKMDEVRGKLDQLQTPCVTYQCVKDEMVPFSSVKELEKTNIEIKVLPKSYHFCFDPEETQFIAKEFVAYCFE